MQALGRTFPAVARASGIAAARAASAPVSAALFRSGFGGLNQGVPVANHLCQGQQWGRRAMATGKKDADLVGKAKKGSVTTIDSKTDDFRKFLKQEIKDERDSMEANPTELPPAGWSRVRTGGYLNGNDDIVILLEKQFGNENICVLTSTEVVDEGGDMEEEYDEDMEFENEDMEEYEGESDGGVGGLMLVAISKKGKSQPLYLECIFDPGSVQIARGHIGAGESLGNEQPSSQVLYSTYISHMQAKQQDFFDAIEAANKTCSSPSFDLIDDSFQEHFRNYLEERGIGPDLADFLMITLHENNAKQYTNFITTLDDWFKS